MVYVNTITYDRYPMQADESCIYSNVQVGKRVAVYYHKNTKDFHLGTIVRRDVEAPFETIIKLDNGRYLRGVECSFKFIYED